MSKQMTEVRGQRTEVRGQMTLLRLIGFAGQAGNIDQKISDCLLFTT